MKIIIAGTKSTIIIAPNPVVGHNIALQLINQPKGPYSVRIIDINGKELLKSIFINTGGSIVQTIQTASLFGRGIYQLELIDAKGSRHIKTLLFL